MTQNKNIIFMGTPDFAVETLKRLYVRGQSIAAVVCPPDKPAGRGQKLKYCAVKKYALSQNLNILQPENLKNTKFLNNLKILEPELIVVVAFRMLPKQVWSIPKKGTINIHASLLPKYRGAAPIHWAIINGEYETGVTSFLIDEDIDTGAVLMSKKCEIGPNENYGDLHDKLKILGAETAHETCEYLFKNQIIPVNQPKITNEKKAPKLYKENCRIDWSHSSIDIHNKIRGLSPYPVAWTKFYLKDQEDIIILQIYKASYEIFCHTQNNGDIEISKKELKIFTKDGCIFIKQIQTSGKKRMDIKSFLNGLSSITFKNAF